MPISKDSKNNKSSKKSYNTRTMKQDRKLKKMKKVTVVIMMTRVFIVKATKRRLWTVLNIEKCYKKYFLLKI